MNNSELSKAMHNLNVKKVRRLLKSKKCLIHGDDPGRDPPIIECIRSRHYRDNEESDHRRCEILKFLVRHGADINANPFGKTPSMIAAQEGFLEGLKVIVKLGADLNILTSEGYTPIMLAAKGGHAGCVRFLTREIGTSMINYKNKYGQTAVALAAQGGFQDCILVLVEGGADLNILTSEGDNPLLLASKGGHTDCVKYLIDFTEASMLDHRNKYGQTALMMAAFKTPVSGTFYLWHLVRAKATIDVKDANGYTALMLALFAGSSERARLLLRNGAQVSRVSHFGETPFTFADREIIDDLIRYGLDPALSRLDRHRLHIAVMWDDQAVLQRLIVNGFPPLDLGKHPFAVRSHPLPETPMSPLALAILSCWPETARYLIATRFFTRYDIVQLCWDWRVRQSLHYAMCEGGDQVCHKAEMCLTILDLLSTKVHSLRDLCLVSVSSALSQDLVHDLPDLLRGKHKWLCKPTFREKVELLKLPPSLKRELLHDTPSAKMSRRYWKSITLEREEQFTPIQ
ncbi:ankyrin repeat protein [Elysia marginata]|uniref:Ankyrin repeat protein n=1 Tax=Elysia marginata TaxID=1093978 RepID=A0AAV4EIE7_9GAST|nr:ankyrin repeat protein [Elysia marginata]